MRGILLLLLFALGFLTVTAHRSPAAPREPRDPSAPQPSRERPSRLSMLLNGMWSVRVPGADEAMVRVPEMVDMAQVRDAALYRTVVQVPSAWKKEQGRLVLHFDRVLFGARVRWNGAEVGSHFGNRTGFDVDVTAAVRYGAPNSLEVRVSSAAGKDPATLRFYVTDPAHARHAAIAGDVRLEMRPRVEVARDRIATSVEDHTLEVTTLIDNHSDAARTVWVARSVRLGGATMGTLPAQLVTVPPRTSVDSSVRVSWPDASPWGPPSFGKPILYTLRTDLQEADGRLVDRSCTRFGFRSIGVQAGQLTVNTRPFFIWGLRPNGQAVERHGLALQFEAWRALGFNTVESHEEARLPSYYDVADRLGMMVVSGNYCCGMLRSGLGGDLTQEPLHDLEAALEAWVVDERNHPSILLWNPCGADVNLRGVVSDAVSRADATRPLAYRDYLPVMESLDGRPSGDELAMRRGAWFIFETTGQVPMDEGAVDVLAPFMRAARASGAFGVVINALPLPPATASIAWPSPTGPDPRPPTFSPSGVYEGRIARLSEALGAIPAAPSQVPPELLVSVTHDGRPVRGALVAVTGDDMETTVEATDADGNAWFMLPEAGLYTAGLVEEPAVRVDRVESWRDVDALRRLATYDTVTLVSERPRQGGAGAQRSRGQ